MKWIGNRISYEDHSSHFTLIISGKTEDWKFNLMIAWAIAWLFCGFSVLYLLFFTNELQDQGLYYTTFLGFWFYFFYKITRAIMWRKFGMEFIKMDGDFLSLKRSLWGYGKAKQHILNNITSFEQDKLEDKSFAKVFNDSFWVLGQATVIMNLNNQKISFGAQVSSDDGKQLVKVLTKKLNKFKSVGELK